jgi:hypothetical protein
MGEGEIALQCVAVNLCCPRSYYPVTRLERVSRISWHCAGVVGDDDGAKGTGIVDRH